MNMTYSLICSEVSLPQGLLQNSWQHRLIRHCDICLFYNLCFSARMIVVKKQTICRTLYAPSRITLTTGWERLIRSHSSARFCFELSGNSN